ncbi:MAG: MqnA/MqnD/SBP family protein [Planctomycetota bacterium]
MARELTRELTLGHSPDPDDAFMFYALAAEKIDTEGLSFRYVLQDIETLNRRALNAELDITAISVHAYASVLDRYALLPSGASMGEGYGPMVVSKEPLALSALPDSWIAIPGTLTTAYLTLKLVVPKFHFVVMPFDLVMDAVADGAVDAGLIIHEGQLTYRDRGLHKVIDLGEWWQQETGLPLPLGANVVRKDLGPALIRKISRILSRSIRYGLEHREEALDHALRYARDMGYPLTDRFVAMYVNDLTVDYGEKGRRAVRTLLERAHKAGLLPQPVELEFVE